VSTITLTPAQLTRRLREDARGAPGALARGINLSMQRGRARLVHESPVDTGQYKNSWRVVKAGLTGTGGQLRNDSPMAGVIEMGARPHNVSREGVEALTLWVRRQLGGELRLNLRAQSPGGQARTVDYEAQIRQIVRGIVHKLREHGQVGRWVVRDNLELLSRYLREEVERAVEKFMDRPVK
jgi:hypothetical protein